MRGTRKYFLDNIRWIFVLFLFVYHTLMIYVSFESFYIKQDAITTIDIIVFTIWPWYMTILFVIAGISTKYALMKRDTKSYLKERVHRLLIPFISGVLLLIPMQTFYAEKFHNLYTGGYFAQYQLFFTKSTDLTGYHGGFTPGHLWFLLYLFLISLIGVVIINLIKVKKNVNFNLVTLMLLFFIPTIAAPILDIAGKSLGEYLTLFLLGYYVLSNDNILDTLEKNKKLLGVLTILLMIIYNVVISYDGLPDPVYSVSMRLYGWVAILFILGFSKKYLNMNNKLCTYFSKASFPIYILHQSFLVLVAYYTVNVISNPFIQIPIIILGSFLVTMISYEVLKRFSITRYLLGIKN